MGNLLPAQFGMLEPFLVAWAAPGSAGRLRRRLDSTAQERVEFYRAMAPHAEAIIDHLNAFPLDAMPADAERLFSLMLALAEIALTEEVIGQEIEVEHAKGNRLMRVDKELDGR